MGATEAELVEAITVLADQVCEILEAPRGLKHPRHQEHLAPATARVKDVLANYFRRQGAAILADIRPHIEHTRAMFEEIEDRAIQEAGEWVTINGHPVLIGGDAADNAERVARAKKATVLTKKEAQRIADHSEQVLSESLGLNRTPDNSPFDLRSDEIGIEVKTMINQKNNKITMSKAAIGRKIAEQLAEDLKIYTVVADRRAAGLTGGGNATYYVREGVGSFRLNQMTKISVGDLRKMVRG